MIDLHERLSEFSYGFGATREAEAALRSVGVTATPFLPSLIHEKVLGFDVAFDRPGAVLMLQFKLGQQMKRYRSVPPGKPGPPVSSPFWRFHLDTTEDQFRLLVDAEQRGAEAYYVAPRFSDWQEYEDAYQAGAVLDRSLMVRPSDIERELTARSQPAGRHRVVYDLTSRYICSEPIPLEEVRTDGMVAKVFQDLRVKPRSLGDLVSVLSEVRTADRARRSASTSSRQAIQARARSAEDAAAAMFAVEAWSVGAQAIFVTDPEVGAPLEQSGGAPAA
ncbi:MAG: hypothetical protein EPN98_14890 [Phenylobacterium sp.]|uniref:hypothetical protein n=1 Tax=Phenylobacterium sp. TaxID=1871053 RepID=UPI0011FF3709|nr:hypothetical protein [Phenylobacterium sp.]TAL32093.1 MAG: hypothetical protein EPN98_14890 [Phenylobacterium sp.]